MSSISTLYTDLTSLIVLSNEVLTYIQSPELDLMQLNDAQVLRTSKLKCFFNQYDRSAILSSLDALTLTKLNELQALDGEIIGAIYAKKDSISKQIIAQKNNKKATNIYNKNR
jgi:hypothetical protein